MARIKAVTIERQYCSGGREIGKLAAEKLGIECYDQKLAAMTADKLGVPVEEIVKYEETLMNPLLSPLSFKSGIDHKKNMSELVFEAQAEIITKLAKQGPCIIVGRCADYILKHNVPTLSVFVYASSQSRMQHASDFHNIPYEDIKSTLKKMDKKRADYYRLNTQKEWDSMYGYDVCINSGKVSIEAAAEMIAHAVTSSC